ncbi:MAG: SGNH/GDSL hydrolase family protein [Planctomycetes bacterium]|nr:SGNH/GDSL hydrolase family protein [Planctomycetota bacterium]
MTRRRRLVHATITIVLALLLLEAGIRLALPDLGADLEPAPAPPASSPFRLDPEVAYEPLPGARLPVETGGDEVLNDEGFRGQDMRRPKPAGVVRIGAVGDSVVQALSVGLDSTWEEALRRALEGRTQRPVEVINAGVGGYVSWQAVRRLERRVLQYEPDVVLALVGWNDLVYSSLGGWAPGMDLSAIERRRREEASAAPARPGEGVLRRVCRASYIARLLRTARNHSWNARRRADLIAFHQRPSGTPFNERALADYLEHLGRLRDTATRDGARLGLIVWPTILGEATLDSPAVHARLIRTYENFPLSTCELWIWIHRYWEAMRAFGARHPDVVLIDVARAWAALDERERLIRFTDLAHLTEAGNEALARAIEEALLADPAIARLLGPDEPR